MASQLSKVKKVQREKRDLFSQKRIKIFGISSCSPESDHLKRTGIRKKIYGRIYVALNPRSDVTGKSHYVEVTK